ncbi:MAG: DNA alkylation repair protein [Candidatus Diapherotrites archaeon]|uniref:DNA alkylation repair protein n=1 Tax=Candidatus Iainarchaeum sp. TaxID=3101447 RepID=A0A8T4C990_9ARCH|nr:DNA alkylation repair protein [Candidatus Diapherotrites archaeon]
MKGILNELKKYSSEERKRVNLRFFKTGKGEYGEGDQFHGVAVPDCRKVASTFLDIPLSTIENSLKSPIHEERLTALLILVEKYAKEKNENVKKELVEFYLKNKKYVNNWDLVDSSADKILGNHLLSEKENRKIIYDLVESPHVWDRRIGVIATFAFIKKMQFSDTFVLCEKLLKDDHDLMHKACGWMLREIGKRDEKALEGFLHTHAQRMPRTMLRYAIERFPENKRKMYLRAKFT